jgi:hypothetical protein
MLKKAGNVGSIGKRASAVWVTALWLLSSEAGRNAALAEEFDIINQSKTTIYHLYVAPKDTSHWSDDALGEDEEDALEPGDSVTLRDLDSGQYQFKIMVDSDRACVISNVLLEGGKTLELNDEFLENCR